MKICFKVLYGCTVHFAESLDRLPDDFRMIEACRSIFRSFNANNLSVCIGWVPIKWLVLRLFATYRQRDRRQKESHATFMCLIS